MSLKSLIQRNCYGNPDQDEQGSTALPHTRIELFKLILSVRKGYLFSFSLLYALPWLPAIFWSILVMMQLLSSVYAPETCNNVSIHTILLTYSLIMMPLVLLTGPFNVAASYVMRNWARDEHADLLSDYKASLKNNWRQGILFGLTSGIMIPIFYISMAFYLNNVHIYPVFYILIGILIMMTLLWKLCCMVIPTMVVTYNMPYLSILRNALIISLAQLPRAVGIWLISMVFPILIMGVFAAFARTLFFALPVTLIYMGLFGFGLNMLIYASYANMVCEKYINSRIEGAPTNIGLHDEL